MVIDVPKETSGGDGGFFLRKDVRETAGISGAPKIGDFTSAQHGHSDAVTGGTIDHPDLTSTGTNTHSQIDTHIASDGSGHSDVVANTSASHAQSHNMASHTDDYSEGEGIEISAGNVISGENATITNKGIASFATADFSVASGVVSASADTCKTLDGDSGTATASQHNFDILGGAGINTVGESNNITISGEDSTAGNKGIVIVSPGEGMDVSYSNGIATISGENATTSNKGIASFDSVFFDITSGAVTMKDSIINLVSTDTGAVVPTSNIIRIWGGDGINTVGSAGGIVRVHLNNKTSYWSVNGNSWIATNDGTGDDATDVTRGFQAGGEGGVEPDVNGRSFLTPVDLPQGAVVTAAVVYGDAGAQAESWVLVRHVTNSLDSQSVMASANIGTTDSTISNATIDNQTYSYWIEAISLDAGDRIFGARVTYTTDYD